MIAIRLQGVSKSFGKGAPVLSKVYLDIADTERIALVGPSGAGKTTLLRLIAGFEAPDAGRIFIGDRDVTSLPPEERDIGFVFQSHALYPHLTVAENLGFPLRLRNVPRPEIAERVKAMAALLQIDSILGKRPQEISGGETQRVALGRALIRQPAALFMDEPLSSLPPDLRLRLRHELTKLHERQRRPLLYVTHDHEEALALGERVAVLNEGRLQQIGSPREIYEKPANRFVAAFIGRPPMNFLPSRKFNGVMGVRPEHFEVCSGAEAWFSGKIEGIQYGGAFCDLMVEAENRELIVRRFGTAEFKVGDSVALRAADEHIHYFDSAGNRITS